MKTRISLQIWAIFTLVAAMALSTSAQRIVHVPFNTPRDSYLKTYGNDQIVNREYYYPQLDSMGATHAHEWHSRLAFGADTTLHFRLLRDNDLSIFVVGSNDYAQAVVGNDTTNFSAIEAIYAHGYDDEFWDDGGLYRTNLFKFPRNIGAFDQVNQWLVCDPAQHNAGFIFQDQSTLDGSPMNYRRRYAFEMEVYKDAADNSNNPVFSLIIADTTYGPTTYSVDTIIVRANQLPQDQFVFAGGYIPKIYKAGTSTKFSLYWHDLVKARFRKLRIADEYYYHLHISPDGAAYWRGLVNFYDRQLRQFNNDVRVYGGVCLDEPWWTTWGSMGRVRDSLLTSLSSFEPIC